MCVAIVQLFDFMNIVFTGVLKGFEKKAFSHIMVKFLQQHNEVKETKARS